MSRSCCTSGDGQAEGHLQALRADRRGAGGIEFDRLTANEHPLVPADGVGGDNLFSYAQAMVADSINCPESSDTVMTDMRESARRTISPFQCSRIC
jgi:hypothetical protein